MGLVMMKTMKMISKLVVIMMNTVNTMMVDLNKSVFKAHLAPAVGARCVRGIGRHHAGDQRHLVIWLVLSQIKSASLHNVTSALPLPVLALKVELALLVLGCRGKSIGDKVD